MSRCGGRAWIHWLFLPLWLAGCTAPSADPLAPSGHEELVNWTEFNEARLADAVFEETNRVRRQFGLRRLRLLPRLEEAAGLQASTMAMLGQLSHDNPFRDRGNVYDRVRAAGLEPVRAGENVAITPVRVPPPDRPRPADDPWPTYAELAARIVDQWMNSPPHRLAILSREFTHLACATLPARSPLGGEIVYSVQVFIVPRRGR